MAYSFNPFTGTFDNTPSTVKGDEAFSALQSLSANWLTNNQALSTFLPLTGGTVTGGVTFSNSITGINDSHLVNFIVDGGSYN